MAHVVVTGGTGLVGRHLVRRLSEQGHAVTVLTRGPTESREGVDYRHWDPRKGELDRQVLVQAEVVVHLAGANIAAGRWTKKRKREILQSRVGSAALLLAAAKETGTQLRAYVSASATGYYGSVTTDHEFTEEDPPGNDFLAHVCRQWEEAADRFSEVAQRVAKLRTGIVLARDGGALSKLAKPVRYGVALPLGSGNQRMPWIHVEDLVELYLRAVESDAPSGALNVVAPDCPTNATFMKTLAEVLGRPFVPVGIPALALRLALGEMATSLLEGSCVSARKVLDTGYRFRHPGLRQALEDLLLNTEA